MCSSDLFPSHDRWGEMIEFADICGYFVSLRSGLCDILSISEAKKIVIYPDINFLEKFGFCSFWNNSKFEELVFSENTISEILQIIKNG